MIAHEKRNSSGWNSTIRRETCVLSHTQIYWDNKRWLTGVAPLWPLRSFYRRYFYVFLFFRKSFPWFPKWCKWCEFHRALLPPRERMFPANLSWMEQTAVIGTRKWRQVEDSGIHRKERRADNGPHLTGKHWLASHSHLIQFKHPQLRLSRWISLF